MSVLATSGGSGSLILQHQRLLQIPRNRHVPAVRVEISAYRAVDRLPLPHSPSASSLEERLQDEASVERFRARTAPGQARIQSQRPDTLLSVRPVSASRQHATRGTHEQAFYLTV
eukprot:1211584-Pleurochrysis_carterae.AAC.1